MNSTDTNYREVTVTSVRASGDGWDIGVDYGHLHITDSPVEPTIGMTARIYPAQLHSMIRGLFLDGQQVYYRTAEQEAEYREIELYGATPADWLHRWDSGRSVWTIEMGGIGPGYEQAIQVTTAEVVRHLVNTAPDATTWDDTEAWIAARKSIESAVFASPTVTELGLSAAQAGAAVFLGAKLYREGPRRILTQPGVKDRLIQASKFFPTAVSA